MSNDRLKFRVWVEKDKAFLTKTEEVFLADNGDKYTVSEDASQENICLDRLYEGTIEQCTGLCDTNGILIYEGDIILQKYKGDYIQLVVEWISERALFELVSLHKITRTKIYWRITQDWISEFEVRVVGNIHENPELLEVKR